LPRLGLRENLAQFTLLVIANAGVGGLVGVQRSVVPLIAEREFHLASSAAATAFIVSFGLVKAFANLISGILADRYSRRAVLIAGALLGVPVPFLIMWAPSWEWIVAANALLGLNQGLAWSMTVAMKIDLVGGKRRGLALGLNEFAGYASVGAAAWAAGWIASRWALRPEPFFLAAACALLTLLLATFFIRDTKAHARAEQSATGFGPAKSVSGPDTFPSPSFSQVFALTTFRDRHLFACSQAGLVNNLNDAVMWGVLPLLLASRGLDLPTIGMVAALYPLTWGFGQLGMGALSDAIGRRPLVVWGMWLQAAAHAVIGFAPGGPVTSAVVGATMLGLGTAMVYPTLLAAVSDAAAPAWRARALSVYRFWRDLGYAAGALAAGLIADRLGLAPAVHAAGIVTFASGVVAWASMRRA
jgi:MFS family permease